MDEGRGDLSEGQEREDALVEPGVGNLERRLFHDAVAVEKEIEVDLARPPMLPADPPDPLLDLEQPPQRRTRREQGREADRRIEETSLRRADRNGVPDVRDGADPEPRLAIEPGERRAQVPHPIAEVRPETDVRVDHSTSVRNRSRR